MAYIAVKTKDGYTYTHRTNSQTMDKWIDFSEYETEIPLKKKDAIEIVSRGLYYGSKKATSVDDFVRKYDKNIYHRTIESLVFLNKIKNIKTVEFVFY